MGLVKVIGDRSVMYKKKTYTKDSPPFKVDQGTEVFLMDKDMIERVEVEAPSEPTIIPEPEVVVTEPEPLPKTEKPEEVAPYSSPPEKEKESKPKSKLKAKKKKTSKKKGK